jgi:hypothetical protein
MYCFGVSAQDEQMKAELFVGGEPEELAKGVRLDD